MYVYTTYEYDMIAVVTVMIIHDDNPYRSEIRL